MSWLAIAERAARRRSAAILGRIHKAIAEHAPDATIESQEEEVRARARGLKRRWVSEAGLRFARRTRT